MATALRLARRPTPLLRHSSTLTTPATSKPSHHKDHINNQVYQKPSPFIGRWKPPQNDPKAAQSKLAELRRDYAKQVKELRKHYIYEMELQKQEQMRKDEARREEILRQREERKKSKAAAAQARAAELKAFEEEFRQTLMKERAEKLEYWRMREKAIEEKKNSKKELMRKQSSLWIDEQDLEKKIRDATIDVVDL